MVTSPQTTNVPSVAWKNAVIVGLGATGFSVARYLFGRGMQVTVVDAQPNPPLAIQLAKIAPGIDIRTGEDDVNNLRSADVLIVSPGVSFDHPTVRKAQDIGIEIVGDIELFARAVTAPVIGITGSNGKSTVTQWLAVLLRVAGHKVLVGGNIGPPALDLLADEPPECYVLECSSFQLESTQSLCLRAGAILNVTPDHLDRYVDLTAYQAAKWRIAKRCIPKRHQQTIFLEHFGFHLLGSISFDDCSTVYPNPFGKSCCICFTHRALVEWNDRLFSDFDLPHMPPCMHRVCFTYS